MKLVFFARKLRRNETDAEKKLWSSFRNRRFLNLKFRRQYPIEQYIVDFCCAEKRLIVELDGGQHLVQKLKDDKRTQFLNDRGYVVLRFWDNEVLTNTELVLNQIKVVLDNPHPNPLP